MFLEITLILKPLRGGPPHLIFATRRGALLLSSHPPGSIEIKLSLWAQYNDV
jgi:hypothetical protein